MGNMTAIDIAASGVSMEQQIAWHLQGNHYPPVPVSMVQACIEAIDAYWEDDLDRKIDLPIDGLDRDGNPFQIQWRGEPWAPAREIIINHHLDAWCNEDEDDYVDED
jgi:hypothetical protein